jgi:cyclin T
LEDSACSSWGINNNLAFASIREESSCNITGFTGSSALARKAEDIICNSASFDNEPVLRRVEGSNSTVGSSSEGSDHYLSREEIERCSPSRKDGIDLQKETYFRYSYCAFLQTLGMRLQL